jgi:hypothetical protein
VNHGWGAFSSDYEKKHRSTLGPLHPSVIATVESLLRCGDLASGFTRLECSDCGHERLLAFTCKTRHFCPACHQRRVRSTSEWIAGSVCHQVPHRQVVFTIPKVLRGIFRKRRQLLSLLFQSAIDTLTESFRLQLGLPEGKIGAVAAVHTFVKENHMERHQQNRHLPLQAPSQHQTQFRNFQGSRIHCRRPLASASKGSTNGPLLWRLF